MIKKVASRQIAAGFLCIFFVIGLVNIENASAATTVTLSSPYHTETTITLSWTESGDLLFSSYTLYMSSVGVNGSYTDVWSTSDKGQTSTSVYNLSRATFYYFYIVDSGTLVGTANSNTLEQWTTESPSLVGNATSASTASISWSDANTYSSLEPFVSYTIQMSNSSSSGPWSTLTTITDQTQSAYMITGLSYGTFYVQMYDTVGNGYTSYSNVAPISISPPTPTPTIPEFPSLAILMLFMAVMIIVSVALVIRKRHSKRALNY